MLERSRWRRTKLPRSSSCVHTHRPAAWSRRRILKLLVYCFRIMWRSYQCQLICTTGQPILYGRSSKTRLRLWRARWTWLRDPSAREKDLHTGFRGQMHASCVQPAYLPIIVNNLQVGNGCLAWPWTLSTGSLHSVKTFSIISFWGSYFSSLSACWVSVYNCAKRVIDLQYLLLEDRPLVTDIVSTY